jgi:hypothetical protein
MKWRIDMPIQRRITNPIIIEPLPLPPSDDMLRTKTITYLKENKHKAYIQMKKDGTLDSYLSVTVKMCRETAKNLIGQGMVDEEAWSIAIRQDIFESESD